MPGSVHENCGKRERSPCFGNERWGRASAALAAVLRSIFVRLRSLRPSRSIFRPASFSASAVQEDALFSLRSSACKHPPASAPGTLRFAELICCGPLPFERHGWRYAPAAHCQTLLYGAASFGIPFGLLKLAVGTEHRLSVPIWPFGPGGGNKTPPL